MYHQFFGLTKDPFSMTPDPAFLFLTAPHREALAGVTYAILHRKGFVVLTGDAGTGKTTLLTRIFQSIPTSRVRFSVVLNPTLTPSEFLELALLDFGITDIPASKAQRLTLLQQFLIDAHRKQQVAVLVVDEAHKLPPDVLEEIRLLSNFELAETKLLQIVLAGQTELGEVLNRQDLRQLKQRIAVRLYIHPLSATGVEHYIKHRWEKAGAIRPHPFNSDAVALIAEYSRGIPRLVNAICDNALMLAYAEHGNTITRQHIGEVAGDLDLLDSPGRPIRAALSSRTAAPMRPGPQRPAPATPRASASIALAERKATPGPPENGHANGIAQSPPAVAVPLPTLAPYQKDTAKTSRFRRLAGKLGFSAKPAKDEESS
jgi:general secretion pathway protein A